MPNLIWCVLGVLAVVSTAAGQPSSDSPLAPPANGVRRVSPADGTHVLTHATVHTAPGQVLEDATVIIRDGMIAEVIRGGGRPAGTAIGREHDCTGLHLYAGFIEPYLEVEVPRPDPAAPGNHWNRMVTPQRTALDRGAAGVDARTLRTLRELGFTAAAISPAGGVFRGTSAVVSLADVPEDPSSGGRAVHRTSAFQAVAFETSRGSSRDSDDQESDSMRWSGYPNSRMGAIALIRQTLSDADWQAAERANGRFSGAINALDALSGKGDPGTGTLLLFETGDELDCLRAATIKREFERPAALLGSGSEYQRLSPIIEDALPLILPLNFPQAPRVKTVGEQNAAELDAMMHWEQAPTNPRRVDAALRAVSRESDVSLTTSRISDRDGGRGAFRDRLDSALKHGLEPERALAMLTTNPARLLGLQDRLGTLEAGRIANIIVADGPLFTARPDAPERDEPGYIRPGRIIGLWIDGREERLIQRPEIAIGGHYELEFTPAPPGDVRVTFDIDDSDRPERPRLRITKSTRDPAADEDGEHTADISVSGLVVQDGTFRFSFEHEPFGESGVFVNTGVIDRDSDGAVTLRAQAVRSSGRQFSWVARRTGPAAARKRSLAGSWPLIFDKPAGGTPVLIFDRGNILSIATPPGVRATVEGKPLKVTRFEYDGSAFNYEFDQSQVLGPDGKPLEGIAKVKATLDWSVNPPRFRGIVTAPGDAGTFEFSSVRRDANPFAGSWAVTQADGRVTDPNGPDGLTIVVTAGKKADQPILLLRFARPNAPPVEIHATDVETRGGKLYFKHALEPLGGQGQSRDELTIAFDKSDPAKDVLIGLGRQPDETIHTYQASRGESDTSDRKESAAIAAIPEQIPVPFGAYGLSGLPPQDSIVLTGATVWTCRDAAADDPGQVIEDGAIVINEGKLVYVGPSAGLPRLTEQYRFIDVKGKFITPGIIDCHSHTGISGGVNESGQAVTAEVRIGDVTDPDNVSWYRQLAGGVTCVNNLHGSANAVGGQSMVNKIRWGCARPDDMHFESSGSEDSRGALPGIKFALGENPKQSNWGDRNVTRYPQTRMGVETLIRDRFTAAKEYAASMRRSVVSVIANGNGNIAPQDSPRRDLELEALAQVLAGTRLVHCHSYRQDEILMLTRIAKEFNFKIGTFQHILEGYKVADELVKHSGGGSAFSDWWAYKIEVQDAIPAAGPLMAEQGVTVSYNSDSDEMARRLNVEAGKATKYSRNNKGGPIPVHEAFKFVTLNPARQLHIDRFTGSLEAGKDADIAVWSGVPTSPMSRCEMTFVDGRLLFSRELDAAHRERIRAERARLIQKILASPSGRARGDRDSDDADSDDPDEPPPSSSSLARDSGRGLILLRALQTAEDAQRELYLSILRRGLDPRWMSAGDCGCGDSAGGN